MKGTDQQGSLGPDGVNRMIRDIRIAEHWLGREELYIDPCRLCRQSETGAFHCYEQGAASRRYYHGRGYSPA